MPSYIGGSLMDVAGRSPGMAFQVDPKDLERLLKKLDKIRGKPLGTILQRQTLYAADLLVRPIRAQTPVLKGTSYIEGSAASGGRKAQRGLLRRSVKARRALKRFGATLVPTYGALVGPTAPHRHFIIHGTAQRYVVPKDRHASTRYISFGPGEVRPIGFSAGRMTPNPFVDRAAKGFERKAADIVKRAWIGEFR